MLGTPDLEVLAKFKQNGAAHVNFDFPQQKGIGIAQLIPHASPECVDLMMKMLAYDASERITAREALRHPYFREVRASRGPRAPEGLDGGGCARARRFATWRWTAAGDGCAPVAEFFDAQPGGRPEGASQLPREDDMAA